MYVLSMPQYWQYWQVAILACTILASCHSAPPKGLREIPSGAGGLRARDDCAAWLEEWLCQSCGVGDVSSERAKRQLRSCRDFFRHRSFADCFQNPKNKWRIVADAAWYGEACCIPWPWECLPKSESFSIGGHLVPTLSDLVMPHLHSGRDVGQDGRKPSLTAPSGVVPLSAYTILGGKQELLAVKLQHQNAMVQFPHCVPPAANCITSASRDAARSSDLPTTSQIPGSRHTCPTGFGHPVRCSTLLPLPRDELDWKLSIHLCGSMLI